MDTPKETNGAGQIYGLMAQILSEVESVGKGRKNTEQNYRFRGIDDVYEAVHPLFAKHKIFTLPRVLAEDTTERTTRNGGTLRFVRLTMAYDFFAPDGSHVTAEVVGEAMDAGDKASNKAMSAAQKYALIQTLCIPTGDTPDADQTTHPEITGERTQVSKSSTAEVRCPECDGLMWDNRESKRNPRAPDYKCKNKSCDGAIWPEKPAPNPADPNGNDQELREALFDQAERFLIHRGDSEDKRKAALGRLVALSTDKMAEAVDKLVSSHSTEPKEEGERLKQIAKIEAEFDTNVIQEELQKNYRGKKLGELSLDALTQIYADLIPF